MITKETLEEMARKQLEEGEALGPQHYSSMITRKKQRLDLHKSFLTPEEAARLQQIQQDTRKLYGGKMSKEDKKWVQDLQTAVEKRRHEDYYGSKLDPAQVGPASVAAKGKLMPPALKALGKPIPDEEEVDPYGKTHSVHSLGGPTAVVPRLRKENKTITQSRLREIIKEELEVILTDDEVKEMFGIDITEEKEGSVKIKT
jgi:hypothetical protein